jgi:molybdate transport system substrate-binding protein
MKRSPRVALALVVATLLASACGSSRSSTRAAVPTTVPALQGNITVFAASSLTESFKVVGEAFTKANPGVKVTFTFDASSALVAQIVQGAPADVFASADTANMDKLATAGLQGGAPVTFATNRLQIIVGPGNPKGIKGLADLAGAGLKIVVCDPSVPCGRYAEQSLGLAKVSVTPASLEQNVKGVVTKVTAGEADAGIVYATDVRAAGAKAAGVDIPDGQNVVATYPVAATRSSTHADLDTAFIAFLTGEEARAILASFGFGPP